MKNRTRTRLLIGASLALWLPCAAHSQLLYNEKLDAQAKAAMTEYRTMRDAHLAMLKERQAAVTALSERVDKAVIAAVRAERDRQVVRVLARPVGEAGTNETTRRAELDGLLVRRIQALSGLTVAQLHQPTPDQLQLIEMAGVATTGLQEEAYRPPVVFDEAKAVLRMGEFHHRYFNKPKAAIAGDGRRDAARSEGARPKAGASEEPAAAAAEGEPFTYAKFCESTPDPLGKSGAQQKADYNAFVAAEPLKAIPADSRNSVAMRLIYEVCPPVHYAQRQKRLAGLRGAEITQLKALAGIGLSYDEIGTSTGLEPIDLGLSIQQLRGELDLAKASVKKAQKDLKELKRQQKILQEAMGKGLAAELAAAADRIVDIVGKSPDAPTAAPAALAGPAADAAASGQAPAESDPCSGTVTLACARQTAEAYGLASFDKARESALFEIAALLADPKARADAAKANCGPPGAEASDEQIANATRICLTKSAMDFLALRDRAADIAAGRPGELAGLAVLIADAQMRVATAEAKAAALTRRIDNLNAQRAALVNELNILLQAKAHLDQNGSDYRVALLDFGRSVDQGRLAYERAGDQFTLIALNDFAAREEQVVKGRYALIDGLLSTITSSTGSGLKPQELARFLSAIGVTTLGIAEVTQ